MKKKDATFFKQFSDLLQDVSLFLIFIADEKKLYSSKGTRVVCLHPEEGNDLTLTSFLIRSNVDCHIFRVL